MVIAIIVAFVVVIHLQCLVSVYLSLVKIKYSVCVCEKKNLIDKKRIDTGICITESLCCTPEINKTLLINYTPV